MGADHELVVHTKLSSLSLSLSSDLPEDPALTLILDNSRGPCQMPLIKLQLLNKGLLGINKPVQPSQYLPTSGKSLPVPVPQTLSIISIVSTKLLPGPAPHCALAINGGFSVLPSPAAASQITTFNITYKWSTNGSVLSLANSYI